MNRDDLRAQRHHELLIALVRSVNITLSPGHDNEIGRVVTRAFEQAERVYGDRAKGK